VRAAREQVRWDRYIGRVRAYLDGVPDVPEDRRWARAAIGDALGQSLERRAVDSQAPHAELTAELERVRRDRDALHSEEHRVRVDRDRLAQALGEVQAEAERLRADRDRLAGELDALRAKRAVRIAMRLDMLGSRETS
jgi:chromosome segregation ATPase